MEEESWSENHGRGIVEEESWRRRNQLRSFREAYRRLMGDIWKASGEHLRAIWELWELGGPAEARSSLGGKNLLKSLFVLQHF